MSYIIIGMLLIAQQHCEYMSKFTISSKNEYTQCIDKTTECLNKKPSNKISECLK